MTKNEIQTGDSPEVAELKKQIAAAEDRILWAALPITPEFDQMVAVKMRAGLSREDALVCSRRQQLTDAVAAERDKAVAAAVEKFEKEFKGNRRDPEYKQAKAETISKAVADGNFHQRFVEAGGHQLNPNPA